MICSVNAITLRAPQAAAALSDYEVRYSVYKVGLTVKLVKLQLTWADNASGR